MKTRLLVRVPPPPPTAKSQVLTAVAPVAPVTEVVKLEPPVAAAVVELDPVPIAPSRQRSIELGNGPRLPRWFTHLGFDVPKAAQGLRALLESRGVDFSRANLGEVKRLVLTDLDETLIRKTAGTTLRHKVTRELMRDENGAVLHLPTGGGTRELKARYPDLPWRELELDFTEFQDPKTVLDAEVIDVTRAALQTAALDAGAQRFVITARTGDQALEAIGTLASDQRLGMTAVLSSSRQAELQALGVPATSLMTGQQKALLMAALIEIYRPEGADLEQVCFYDDTDRNLATAHELLPALFPKTRFTFVDVVPEGAGFVHRPL